MRHTKCGARISPTWSISEQTEQWAKPQINPCFKGIDRPFRGWVKSSLIPIPIHKLEARKFFSSHFKGILSQDQQKTNRRRLIIFKVTLTGQSHFMRIFVTLRGYINSVQ